MTAYSASRALPAATIRTQLSLPLRFADGYETPARIFTFDHLVDGREHLAFGLGSYAQGTNPLSSRRCRWSGRTANV